VKEVDLLIFDWDGTLVDSVARITRCAQLSFEKMNLPVPSENAVRQKIGKSLYVFMIELLPESNDDIAGELCRVYRTFWNSGVLPPLRVFQGVKKMLHTLTQRGYQLVVATGKSRRGLNLDMPRTGLSPYFTATRCSDESGSKPDPAMVNWLCSHCRVQPEKALMIGDSTHDLEMAERAGIPGIGVLSGCQDESELNRFNPVAILPRTTMLLEFLEITQSN
jgi:phosphoglycolate phosphatase